MLKGALTPDQEKSPGLMWKRHRSVGDVEAARGIGGVVAPLLAGFCLATVAVLVTASDKPAQRDPAVALLSVASVLFLYCMQFSFLAIRYGSTPDQYVVWAPEAKVDAQRARALRQEQAEDRELFDRYWGRSGRCYDFGLLALLAGLVLVMVPANWDHWQHWPPWSYLGVGAGTVAFVVEAAWTFGGWHAIPGFTRWMTPGRADVRSEIAVSDMSDGELASLGYGVLVSAPAENPPNIGTTAAQSVTDMPPPPNGSA